MLEFISHVDNIFAATNQYKDILLKKHRKNMDNNIKDKLVLEAILERFEKQRLPRLLDIEAKVEQGNTLDNYDIEFLEEVFSDAKENERYLQTADDQLKALFMKVLSLYKNITQKALENEQKS